MIISAIFLAFSFFSLLVSSVIQAKIMHNAIVRVLKPQRGYLQQWGGILKVEMATGKKPPDENYTDRRAAKHINMHEERAKEK